MQMKWYLLVTAVGFLIQLVASTTLATVRSSKKEPYAALVGDVAIYGLLLTWSIYLLME